MSQSQTADAVFAGPGEMMARCRAFDWASTPLGPVERWSQSLRTIATAVLASRNPMLVFWGPSLIQIYNDAFRPSLGPATGLAPRHPRALGMSAPDFWTDVWDAIGAQVERVMEQGESFWFEDLYLPIERGAGVREDAWWTYSYSPVRDDDGSINGTLVVCLETTSAVRARSRVEFERKRLADLFRHAPAFMCVLRGPEHVVELVNENYQQLMGFRDVIGKPVRQAVPEIVGQGFDDLLDRVLATGEPYLGTAVTVKLQVEKDAPLEERQLNMIYQAITEADGSRSGIFVHGVDVTAVTEARAAAEAANRSKSEFLAVMSHELRTPLNAIEGYAALLELGIHGPLTPAQLEDVQRIRRSERHLLGLINDVLNYTRIEAGSIQYQMDDVSVEDVVATCVTLIEPQRQARELELVLNDITADLRVRADPDRFQQILLNLLTNAIKFTDIGGRITIEIAYDEDVVRIDVADTGRGIAPTALATIFEPFVQVDARYTRVEEGVGLGLAISRDLARAMHGDLSVTSEVGVGSTFTLTLARA